MVEDGDAQELSRLCKAAGEGDVLGACLEDAGWMVVGHDDRGGPIGDRIGKHLARMDLAGVEKAYGDHAVLDDLVGPAERQANEVLLALVSDVLNVGKNIGRGPNPRIKPGMVLAIEPMINIGTDEVVVLEDDWTVVTVDNSISAHFEHTVAVFSDRTEILTSFN